MTCCLMPRSHCPIRQCAIVVFKSGQYDRKFRKYNSPVFLKIEYLVNKAILTWHLRLSLIDTGVNCVYVSFENSKSWHNIRSEIAFWLSYIADFYNGLYYNSVITERTSLCWTTKANITTTFRRSYSKSWHVSTHQINMWTNSVLLVHVIRNWWSREACSGNTWHFLACFFFYFLPRSVHLVEWYSASLWQMDA